jgi:hypothetical protein
MKVKGLIGNFSSRFRGFDGGRGLRVGSEADCGRALTAGPGVVVALLAGICVLLIATGVAGVMGAR